jgi:endonuclease/exonuclease/phosphatase family metal-dependent hydrolase
MSINRRLRMILFGVCCLLLLSDIRAMFALWAAASEDISLRVMTFNLRYASTTPPNAWPARRPIMRDCIRNVAPDLIGTQEGLYPQLKDLAADLPGYEWIGLGREGGSKGEFMAVFYRVDRLEPMAYDHFWLSDTPAVVGSSTWGNTNRRMVTWVRFRERRSSREFFFWNTHLDNDVELARQKGAALIVERADQLKTDLPIILTGDFNSTAGGSQAYDILVKNGNFADTWTSAAERANEKLSTFHGYKPPVEAAVRIDWILTRGPVAVQKIEVVAYSAGGQYPSDHFPVAASLTLKGGNLQ